MRGERRAYPRRARAWTPTVRGISGRLEDASTWISRLPRERAADDDKPQPFPPRLEDPSRDPSREPPLAHYGGPRSDLRTMRCVVSGRRAPSGRRPWEIWGPARRRAGSRTRRAAHGQILAQPGPVTLAFSGVWRLLWRKGVGGRYASSVHVPAQWYKSTASLRRVTRVRSFRNADTLIRLAWEKDKRLTILVGIYLFTQTPRQTRKAELPPFI